MTLKREGKKLWITISYEKPNQTIVAKVPNQKLGIDLGVVKSVVSYDGSNFDEVSFNTNRSRHLDRLSKKLYKKLSKQIRGSNRYEKTRLLIAERAARATRIRNELLEVYTSKIANDFDAIKVDNFSFDNAKLVSDKDNLYRCMKYQFKLRLQTKCEQQGTDFSEVNHFAGQKTTKKCSCCGSTNVFIDKKERTIQCNDCNMFLDRDKNAAVNTYKLI